ncbi:hypothetical protein STEG23_033016, partial [Scotinomys teguina]
MTQRRMDLSNDSSVKEFILLGLTQQPELQLPLFFLFLGIYVVSMVGNLGLMVLIVLNPHLHTPMYFFLFNLAFTDLCSSSVIIPRMLVSFVKQNIISHSECMTQLFFFAFFVIDECYILTSMAYDRYVAICKPLLYQVTISYQVCHLMMVGVYVMGFVEAMAHTGCMLRLVFCDGNIINHYVCDVLPLLKLSCTSTAINQLVVFIVVGVNVTVPSLTIFISYTLIISSILGIHSAEGRSKAFSTCGSHVIAVSLFFGASAFMYLKPSSASADEDKSCSGAAVRPPSASSCSSVPPRAGVCGGLDEAADGRRRAAGHSSEFGSSSGGVSMGLASGVRALIMSNFNKEEFECHILDKGFTAKDIVDQKINEVSSSDDKDAFYVADLGDILKKHLRWRKTLPRVTPFYAVKCNNSRAIVNTLAAIGTVWCHTQNYQASPGTGNELNIDVISVSFHVGSGCTDPETFVQALSDACCVFDMGTEVGFSMYLLDIGGGFPGSEDTKLKFEEITSVINPVLDKYFPPDSGVKVIAEPGRYYVASAFTLAVNIIAKKLVWKEQTGSDDEDESNEQTFMYYVNDGVYESFNCILYDHAHVKALLPKRPKPDEKYYSSSIWGPTCDGLDRIVERCNLPEMHVGDWMLFENMGAYTVAAASTFNGFQRPSIYYVMSRSLWQLMKQIQSHGFPPEVEEQNVGALPLSCAQESGMDRHPASCAAASINV